MWAVGSRSEYSLHYWTSDFNDNETSGGEAYEGWETFYYKECRAPICGAAVLSGPVYYNYDQGL